MSAATKRLQQIFETYDASGDGTLSEDEMTQVFEALGVKGAKRIFKKADRNKDGVIQVHEFISWLNSKDPKVSISEEVTDGQGSVWATITNTNSKAAKKFYFQFTRCQNVELSEGKTVNCILEPGEQKKVKLLTVTGQPYHYAHEVACRSEYAGLEDDPNAFQDMEFPHQGSSACSPSKEYPADVWVRARMLGDPGEAVLFDQIRPQDVKQGGVGNCWLMAAIASVASHPQSIKKLFNTKHLTEDGKYTISLYDAGIQDWTPLVIDEFLPCKLQNGKPVPLFAKPMGEELWAVLLEKAFAKFCHSWGNLKSGGSWWALQAMTGFKSCPIWTMRDQMWSKKVLKEDWAKGESENARGRKVNYTVFDYPSSIGEQIDLNQFFELLHSLGTKSHLMACAWERGKEKQEGLTKGIVGNHAYSLLEVVEEAQDDGTPVRLIQLRNPWGYREWTGDWGDSSDLWQQNPELHERMKPKMVGGNDGKFFISLEDWGKCFNWVTVCPIQNAFVELPAEPGRAQTEAESLEAEPEGQARLFIDSDDEAQGPQEWIAW